jgi:hypothetical protein
LAEQVLQRSRKTTKIALAGAFPTAEKKKGKKRKLMQRVQETCRPEVFYFPLFPFLFVPGTVQSGFVPHVTFLVQKLLGEMEKCGK